MSADLDALLTHVYVLVDDLLPARRRFGRPPRISDSELICLAVAQVLLDCPNERRFLRLAKQRLGHLFPYIPGQSGFNKRLRALAPRTGTSDHAFGEVVALVLRPAAAPRLDACPLCCFARDGAPLRPGRDRRLRLLPLTQPLVLGLPALPALLPRRAADQLRARPGERSRARRCRRAELDRVLEPGQVVISDKGFAGAEFERHVATLGGLLLRPDRKDEQPRSRLPRLDSATRSNQPSTRSKTNSRSNATAAAPSPASSAASPDACSPSPPPSSTTHRPETPAANSPPTTTKESIV